MNEIFSVGDIVRLKSGGPDMTVEEMCRSVEGRPAVRCAWFTVDKRYSSGLFYPEMLRPISKRK